MRRVAIVGAKRTPIGRFLGGFTWLPAVDLGVAAAKAVLSQAGIDARQVQFLVLGNARQAGNRPNPARQVAHKIGSPYETIAYTVNFTCGSGMLAITHAAWHIERGDCDIAIAAGTENMTRTPFILDRLRMGYRLGDGEVLDGQYWDGLLCPLSNMRMGETAERLAEMYGISRREQDEYAFESQRRWKAAHDSGKWADEVVPVEAPDAKGRPVVVETDEHPRPNTTFEKLAKLRPVFKEGGTVTAGNACGMCDGGAAVLLVAEDILSKYSLTPLAFIEGYGFGGVDPSIMGIGPVHAVRNLLERTGLGLDDFEIVELNEAFAAQVLACLKELPIEKERLNVNGGAIAMGHPIGCTGCRIVVTLLYEMRRRRAKRGLATLCQSGGYGSALSLVLP